jgi:hypothetical protein
MLSMPLQPLVACTAAVQSISYNFLLVSLQVSSTWLTSTANAHKMVLLCMGFGLHAVVTASMLPLLPQVSLPVLHQG